VEAVETAEYEKGDGKSAAGLWAVDRRHCHCMADGAGAAVLGVAPQYWVRCGWYKGINLPPIDTRYIHIHAKKEGELAAGTYRPFYVSR
jgi:hypothetical protein